MQDVIEGSIRLLGWTVLKLLTLGAYKSRGPYALVVEGAAGLLSIAGFLSIVYLW